MSQLVAFLLLLSGIIISAQVQLSVTPSDTKIGRVGEDIILVCTIDLEPNSTLASTDLVWYRGAERVNSTRMSVPGNFPLTLENPQFNDSDLYTCGAEEYGLLEMVSIRFGALPSIPKTSGQNCTNSEDVLVFWETKYNDTNLPTIYKFEYKTGVSPSFSDNLCPGKEYSPCPNTEKGENTCFLEDHNTCNKIDYKITAINALGIESHQFSFYAHDITIPNSPRNLSLEFNGVLWEVTWEMPSGWEYEELWYWVQYGSEEHNLKDGIKAADQYYGKDFQFKDELDPFTLYYVSVAAKFYNYGYRTSNKENDEGWSKPVVGNFKTEEIQPNGRFIFNISDVSLSSEEPEKVNVFIQWKPMSKEESGGIIRGYNISILLNEIEHWNIQLNGSVTEYWITDQLDQLYYENYNIRVVAFNHKGSVSYEISLSEYPLPDFPTPSPNESVIIAVAVAVCIGLIAIVLVSILFRYIYKTINEAKNIPDVPNTIAAELAQDSDGYMFVNETGDGQQGVIKEVFDTVIPEEDSQPNTLRYEKHIEVIVLPNSSDTSPDRAEVLDSTCAPNNEVHQNMKTEDIVYITELDHESNTMKQSSTNENDNHHPFDNDSTAQYTNNNENKIHLPALKQT